MAITDNIQSAGTLTILQPTGSPINGQKLVIRIKSTNIQTLSWNNIFQGSSGNPLPYQTTGTNSYDYLGFIYNSTSEKWQLLAKIMGF